MPGPTSSGGTSASARPATVESVDLTESKRAISAALADHSDRPVLACVDGHSAAGKSTVAGALASAFNAAVVAGDHFYRVMSESDRARLTPAEGADRYYDWQRMSIEALDPLAAGRPAVFHPYDWSTGEPSYETCEVEPASVVIVEGLFVSRPELRHRYAVSILITADSSQRWERQLARHDATREWLQRWDDAERHHLTVVSPPSSFDVIVDCSAWTTHPQSRRSGRAGPLGNKSVSSEGGGATGRRHGDGRLARREPRGEHR